MMYTADIVGLLRTLAIIFLVYWGIKLFVRYVLPLLGIWAIKKAGKKFQEKTNKSQQFQTNNREDVLRDDGSVRITKPSSNSNQGEFVDFEEVE